MRKVKTGSLLGWLAACVILSACNCGKRQTVIYDQPRIPDTGYYEKAWIDPRILLTDSLFTLIVADRIDSFYVENPPDPEQALAPAIEFRVPPPGCFVQVDLADDRGGLVRPLVARNLGVGFYKVTINTGRLDPSLSRTGTFYLRTEYCGFEVVEQVSPK
ncbi:MAG: hypothetical protein JSW34_09855 [Candidatus Zixiibacteriota bacterium]|nr:MAG: hypothetical protein JSW34_09855 [candidate division Zixibacteria bacterium]